MILEPRIGTGSGLQDRRDGTLHEDRARVRTGDADRAAPGIDNAVLVDCTLGLHQRT